VDRGKVLQSVPGVTDWNAIDPNLVVGESGVPYLAFGSFWSGLKLVRLSADRLSLADPAATPVAIASRRKAQPEAGQRAPANPIEAPFIFRKGKYYYLFASIDYCCKGVNSTYKMIVGRGRSVAGPFLDQEGVDLAHGGGSMLLAGDQNWHGVGHNSVYTFDKTDYLIFHGYDAGDNGKPKLRIAELNWKRKWPTVGMVIE
jgi:arabinan endo-1,5-alpha-L-arabinosidase